MNFVKFKIFILRILVCNAFGYSGNKNIFSSVAFKNITENLSNSLRTFSIINFNSDELIVDFNLGGNLQHDVLPYQLKNLNPNALNNSYELDESAVLSFTSVESLKSFNKIVYLTNDQPKTLIFYVFCVNSTVKEISLLKQPNITSSNKKKFMLNSRSDSVEILQYQYFIVEEENFIRLLTFVYYAPGKCEQQLVEINKFNRKLKKWENSIFELKKFVDFHGCPLAFGMPQQNPGSSVEYDGNGAIIYRGFNVFAIRDFATVLNFKPMFNLCELFQLKKYFCHFDFEVEFVVYYGEARLYAHDKYEVFVTTPYAFENNYVAVPSGEDYNCYEKLLLPFDEGTWIMIVIVFFAATLIISVVNVTTQEIKDFIYGRNVNVPYLNVIAQFFGLSQAVLPKRNFARFLVLLYILYSLIIRTAWQGKMFEFMRRNMTKPPEIQSINDIFHKNYTFFMREHVKILTEDMDFMKKFVC